MMCFAKMGICSSINNIYDYVLVRELTSTNATTTVALGRDLHEHRIGTRTLGGRNLAHDLSEPRFNIMVLCASIDVGSTRVADTFAGAKSLLGKRSTASCVGPTMCSVLVRLKCATF